MKSKEHTDKETAINEDVRELVIARIDAQVPSNLRLSIGSYGGMNKEEMIRHVKEGDEVGKQIVNSHLRFLKAQSSGKVTKALVLAE